MKYIPTRTNESCLINISKLNGIPVYLLANKCVRMGINTNTYISMANQEYLQSVTIVEKNQTYFLVPSSMNYETDK